MELGKIKWVSPWIEIYRSSSHFPQYPPHLPGLQLILDPQFFMIAAVEFYPDSAVSFLSVQILKIGKGDPAAAEDGDEGIDDGRGLVAEFSV